MSLIDMMRNRRSIRNYTGEPIPAEKMEKIIQSALLAPTSRGRRHWEFVLVKEKAMLEKLSHCREHGSAFLANADQAIVVLGNSSLADVWVEDCSIALGMMYLMADSEGVGSCWIQCRNRFAAEGVSAEAYVRNLLHFPEEFCLEAIMAFGMPASHGEAYDLDSLLYEKIHHEVF